MGNFNRNNRSDSYSSRGQRSEFKKDSKSFSKVSKRPFGKGDSKQMFRAVCSECGKSCEVPFKPNGTKPVLCSYCYGKNDSYEDVRKSDKKMFTATCSSCGDLCEVPFKPVPGKDVYCEDCFGDKEKGGAEDSTQFDILNAKLDRILATLASSGNDPKFAKKPAHRRY